MPATMVTAHKRTGRITKRRFTSRRLNRLKVLRLLSMETQKEENSAGAGTADENSEFYNTGRVGRRNAMPDILSDHCRTSTADLPDRLNALSTSDNSSSEAGPSGTSQAACTATTSNSNTTPATTEKT